MFSRQFEKYTRNIQSNVGSAKGALFLLPGLHCGTEAGSHQQFIFINDLTHPVLFIDICNVLLIILIYCIAVPSKQVSVLGVKMSEIRFLSPSYFMLYKLCRASHLHLHWRFTCGVVFRKVRVYFRQTPTALHQRTSTLGNRQFLFPMNHLWKVYACISPGAKVHLSREPCILRVMHCALHWVPHQILKVRGRRRGRNEVKS